MPSALQRAVDFLKMKILYVCILSTVFISFSSLGGDKVDLPTFDQFVLHENAVDAANEIKYPSIIRFILVDGEIDIPWELLYKSATILNYIVDGFQNESDKEGWPTVMWLDPNMDEYHRRAPNFEILSDLLKSDMPKSKEILAALDDWSLFSILAISHFLSLDELKQMGAKEWRKRCMQKFKRFIDDSRAHISWAEFEPELDLFIATKIAERHNVAENYAEHLGQYLHLIQEEDPWVEGLTDDLYDSRGFWPEKLVGYRRGEAVASSIDSKYLVSYSSSESQIAPYKISAQWRCFFS